MKILFAASEAYPLVKTGGLGDVCNSLPNALAGLAEVRLVLPGYRGVQQQVEDTRVAGEVVVAPGHTARILECRHHDFAVPLWLVDLPPLFDRDGNPYTHPDGHGWPDNPERFCVFSRVVAALATGAAGGWRADLVQCNDWQTGMVPMFLGDQGPPSVFTIHNIAYDCQFDRATFDRLGVDPHRWSIDGGEFWGSFSMLKAGMVFSSRLTTVSGRYAEEIKDPEFGYGYAGIVRAQQHKLSGIINGIDDRTWNPATDRYLVRRYGPDDDIAAAKRENRRALLARLGIDEGAMPVAPVLVGSVGRMVYQKGVDLLIDAIPAVLQRTDAQFIIIGSGEDALEHRVADLAAAHPGRVACFIGYSEPLSHLLEAACDLFAMPSRYEPCGLNQMYSMSYGSPPVVRETGGLADTVIDAAADPADATGFVFAAADAAALEECLVRAIEARRGPLWRRLVDNGMTRDFSWRRSAAAYLDLYRAASGH